MTALRYVLIAASALALVACGDPPPPAPRPEATICVWTATNIRAEDRECKDESEELHAGEVRQLDADPACLDADDYTLIGERADDDYLLGVENCEPEALDEAEPAKARKTTARPTTTRKAATPTTTKRKTTP